MTDIRALLDGSVPRIAVSFGDNEVDRLSSEARTLGVDVAEMRIDHFASVEPTHVVRQIRKVRERMPVLATIRAQFEGGGWRGSEAERLALFRAVIPESDAVDVELAAEEIIEDVVRVAELNDKAIVVSFHDFAATPSSVDLERIVLEARNSGADYVKISTMANSDDDVRSLARLTSSHGGEGLIVIAMGARGTLSRIFFSSLGSRLTYASIGNRPAPGQLSYAETFDLMRRFYPEFDREKVDTPKPKDAQTDS